jgi:DeoR family transcriptional regulator of aga operon
MRRIKQPGLLTEERRQKIIELIETQGRVDVEPLAKRFRVSTVTVRADLDALAAMGALIRSRGGAVRRTDSLPYYPASVKAQLRKAEKQRIAKAAFALIRPEQTIALDSGTTTLEVARCIRAVKAPLTVITNSLTIAIELCRTPQVSIVLPGGFIRPNSYSIIGPLAERTVQELNADQAFLGVDGLDPSYGLCTPDMLGARLDALLIQISREVTVVADSSKLGRRSLSLIGRTENIHRLITDDQADPAMVEQIRALGVTVQLV